MKFEYDAAGTCKRGDSVVGDGNGGLTLPACLLQH
jgi:hypothetical protein